MKKIIIIFSIIININLITNLANAAILNQEISNKYKDIFYNDILNSNDLTNYKKIIEYQDKCKWKLANKYIFQIENQILMGHILAQRYLHPKCYRSNFLELSKWLKKFNDHPQAKRIYRLAILRMPKGYKRPLSPTKAKGIKQDILEKKNNN